jgi:nucleoside-diphosphate kinase
LLRRFISTVWLVSRGKTKEKLRPIHKSGKNNRISPVKKQLDNITFALKFFNLLQTMSHLTFTMIKPDAVAAGNIGAILAMINKAGFKIKAMKYTQLTTAQAGKFYEVHKERPFYQELVTFMSSGPIVAAILEKENAVADFRTLIGATDPAKAEEGTIRKAFAKSMGENAVHGSDSDENAIIEGNFFFSEMERH